MCFLWFIMNKNWVHEFFLFFSIMCSNVFWKWGSGLWFNWKLRNMIKYSNALATRKRAVTQRTVYSILLFDSNGTIIYKIIIIPLSVRLESSGWNYKCNRKVFSEVTSSEVWDNCFFFFFYRPRSFWSGENIWNWLHFGGWQKLSKFNYLYLH